MKLYVSGGISGYTREEYTKRFRRAVQVVWDYGHTTVNPLDVVACPEENCNKQDETPHPGHEGYFHSWDCYLRYDLREMLTCDGIAMLPDWRKSKGATLEFEVAVKTGMCVYQINEYFTRMILVLR